MSSLPSPPEKSPAEKTSTPETLSLVESDRARIARACSPASVVGERRGTCPRAARPGRSTGRDARRIRRPRRSLGSMVTMWSSTTMPRLTSSPASLASATLGRMPTAMTTGRPAGCGRPSSRTPSTLPSPRISCGVGAGQDLDCRASRAPLQQIGRRSSSWRSIRVGIRWTTVLFMPLGGEPIRRLEPEQPAADHHRVAALSPPPRASRRHRRGRGR